MLNFTNAAYYGSIPGCLGYLYPLGTRVPLSLPLVLFTVQIGMDSSISNCLINDWCECFRSLFGLLRARQCLPILLCLHLSFHRSLSSCWNWRSCRNSCPIYPYYPWVARRFAKRRYLGQRYSSLDKIDHM